MKNLFTTLSAVLIFSTVISAQRISATESAENIAGGLNPAVSVIVYETVESEILKEWKSLMKKNDAKVSREGGETFADNTLLKNVSNDTLDIFAKTKKEGDGIQLIVAMQTGGQFLSPSKNSGEFSRMKNLLEDFARKLTKESIMEQHKESEKVYGKAVKHQTELAKENEDLHRDIERYKEKIQDAEQNIKKNLQAQEDAKKAIEKQKAVVDAIQQKALKFE